jgi:hypothetical protein
MRPASVFALFVAGLLVLAAQAQQGKPKARDRDVPRAEWVYPKAKLWDATSDEAKDHVTVNYVTSDDIKKVVGYYETLLDRQMFRLDEDGKRGVHLGGSSVENPDGRGPVSSTWKADTVTLDDNGPKARSVKLYTITWNSQDCVAVVVITRCKDETQTHINLTYIKKT